MSIATDIREGGPDAPQAPSGEGWEASLCLAWAQIVEGSATCEHCDGDAAIVIATGADPDYTPVCWEAATLYIDQSRRLGETLFGARD